MIYLDNAAATPCMDFPAGEFCANPSSPHALGIAAERRLSAARARMAEILQCTPREVVFTSGGTEANNLAILGFLQAKKNRTSHAPLPIILAEPWAHPSVLEPVRYAAECGLCTAHIAPAQRWGEISALAAAHTVMACLSHVHHETGDICDIPAHAAALKKIAPRAVIFTDGAQGFCKDTAANKVYTASDLYAVSGHKCHAPTGIGALMVRKGIALTPLLHGGSQENALRAGTENVTAAAHMAHAAEQLHLKSVENNAHAALLRNILVEIAREPDGVSINSLAALDPCGGVVSPYILNMSFAGTRGEVLVHMLSERGICVSMGAACKSRNKRDKSSLALMGFPREISESALRISLSYMNTQEEITRAKRAIIDCAARLRRVSGWRGNGDLT